MITRLMLPVLLASNLMSSCGYLMPLDPLTRPTVIAPNKAPPRTQVYRQCDREGCRMYDRKGNRRVDCERPWSTCKVW